MTEIKARPTLYKGIQMRSRLEADFARYLDGIGEPWAYEPECFASDSGQWLPDFRTQVPTKTGSRRIVYLEIKPASIIEPLDGYDAAVVISRIDALLERMTVAWASKPQVILDLVFWVYGAPGPDFSVVGMRECPWQSWDGKTPPRVWPGMGQAS